MFFHPKHCLIKTKYKCDKQEKFYVNTVKDM